jgi:hypothetical protein
MKSRKNPLAVAAGVSFETTYAAYQAAYEESYRRISDWAAFMKIPFDTVATHVDAPVIDATYKTFYQGRTLANLVLGTRAIPTAKTKAFEKAIKLFSAKSRPGPKRDVAAPTRWFVKNIKSVQLLLESSSWPPISAAEGTKKTLGSISVINQSGRDPDAAEKSLVTAMDAMRRSGVPNIEDIIYGDVFIVGDVSRSRKLMAGYYPAADQIKIIYVKRFEADYVQAIIHEFGHRYWKKGFAPERAWRAHHRKLEHDVMHPQLPAVGETIKTNLGPLKVLSYTSSAMFLEGGSVLGVQAYLNTAKKIAGTRTFPTPYSAKDYEEHFCEALSLYCLGELQEPHKSNFEALVVNHDGASSLTDTQQRILAGRIAR